MKARALKLARGVDDPVERLNLLRETEGAPAQDATNWRAIVRSRLKALNVATLRDDVSPFLERQSDAELLTAEHLERILEQ